MEKPAKISQAFSKKQTTLRKGESHPRVALLVGLDAPVWCGLVMVVDTPLIRAIAPGGTVIEGVRRRALQLLFHEPRKGEGLIGGGVH